MRLFTGIFNKKNGRFHRNAAIFFVSLGSRNKQYMAMTSSKRLPKSFQNEGLIITFKVRFPATFTNVL